jgi:hypothetical protein
MRKVLIFLLLSVTAVGLYLLIRPSGTALQLAPPPPVPPAPARSDAPTAAVSRVFLPIDAPLAAIQARLEREVPVVFQGQSSDPVQHKAIIEDSLRWSARRGPLQLAGAGGRLTLRVATVGGAQVQGKVRALRGSVGKLLRRATGGASDVPFSVHADAMATLTSTFEPTLRPDWRVEPNVTARVEVQRAELPIAGIATVDLRPTVRVALQRKVDQQLVRLRQRLAQDKRLRQFAASAWAQLHRTQPVSDDPRSWLVVRPVGIAATPIEIDADAVRLGLEVSAETRIVVADMAPPNPVRPLPALAMTRATPGYVDINATAMASWERLNRELQARLVEQQLTGSDGTELRINGVRVEPWGDGILLTLDLDARRGRWYHASGRVYLTGRPRLDVDGRVLRLDDLDFALETKDTLVAAARWLMEPTILEELRKRASLDLSPHIERAKRIAEDAIDRFVQQGPENIQLTAQLRDIRVSRLAVTEHSLQIALNARADVRAAITSLDF